MKTDKLADCEREAIMNSVRGQWRSAMLKHSGAGDPSTYFRPARYCFTLAEISELGHALYNQILISPQVAAILRLSVNGPYSQADVFNGDVLEFRAWTSGLAKLGFSIHFC